MKLTRPIRRIQSIRRMAWCISLGAIACATLLACSEVRIGATANTPPTVELSVVAEDVTVTSNGVEATYHAREHERLTLIAVGSDEDDGVRRVWIEGSVGFGCETRSTGVTRHSSGLYDDDSEGTIVVARPGDFVKTKQVDVLNWIWADHYDRACPDGDDLGLTGTYVGHIENFRGGTAETAALLIEAP